MTPANDTEDPLMEKQAPPTPSASLKVPILGVFGPALVGFGIAELIYHLSNNDKTASKMKTLEDLELYYACFAVVFFSWLTRFLNFFPSTLKSAAMDGKAKGNIRVRGTLHQDSRASQPDARDVPT